jgi:predicted N-acyltransferase
MNFSEIVHTIKEIPKEEWDALTGDNVFASYGWLKTVEETLRSDVHPTYGLVSEDAGIVGAAVCYRVDCQDAVLPIDRIMLGRLSSWASRFGVTFFPAMECRPFFSYGPHFLIRRDVDPKRKSAVMEQLLQIVENESFRQERPLVFSCVLDEEPGLIDLLVRSGYLRTIQPPVNILNVGFDNFDEYLKSLDRFSANSRKVIRREMNKNRKEGIVIEEVSDLHGLESRLHELLDANYLKYNRKKIPFKQGFLSALKANLGRDVVIYVARKNGSVIGTSIVFRRNGYGYISLVGTDKEAGGNNFTYFNIAYYKPIMDAIEAKMKQVYCGIAMYDIKRRRGCRLRNSHLFYKSNNKIRNHALSAYFKIHSAWWGRKNARIWAKIPE